MVMFTGVEAYSVLLLVCLFSMSLPGFVLRAILTS